MWFWTPVGDWWVLWNGSSNSLRWHPASYQQKTFCPGLTIFHTYMSGVTFSCKVYWVPETRWTFAVCFLQAACYYRIRNTGLEIRGSDWIEILPLRDSAVHRVVNVAGYSVHTQAHTYGCIEDLVQHPTYRNVSVDDAPISCYCYCFHDFLPVLPYLD